MKDFRYTQAGIVINLKLNGRDNPSCPLCGHYNAMLHDTHDGPNDWTLKCRDCKARVHVERIQVCHIVIDLTTGLGKESTDRVKLFLMSDFDGYIVGTVFFNGVPVGYVAEASSNGSET
jgi:hypothetical protein